MIFKSHYNAAVLDDSGRWFIFNDKEVTPAAGSVVSADAYILFYRLRP